MRYDPRSLTSVRPYEKSSGLHSYIPSLKILIEATHSVLQDVIKHDPPHLRGNKFFLQGESM